MTTKSISLFRPASWGLQEADILAELPALSDWVVPTPTPLEREVLGELPALAAMEDFSA